MKLLDLVNFVFCIGRTSQGVRGLKRLLLFVAWHPVQSRTSQGVRGLKLQSNQKHKISACRTSQGVRGLKLVGLAF